MSSLYQLWRFERAPASGDGYDRLYVPRTGYTTGDRRHDIGLAADAGRFVNTLFSCRPRPARVTASARLAAALHQPARGRGSLPPHGLPWAMAAAHDVTASGYRHRRRLAREARRFGVLIA
jgi:hypothetical protein